MIDLVWLIDDDNIFTYIITRQTEQAAFCSRMEAFTRAEEAMRSLLQNRDNPAALPSVILLDLNMPVMDGWQFLDQFCANKFAKKIQIYILTSSIDPSDLEKMQSYECVSGFYSKPLANEQLHDIVRAYQER